MQGSWASGYIAAAIASLLRLFDKRLVRFTLLSDDSSQVARSWPFPWASTNIDDDVDVDLDSNVELDGSEAIRRR